MVTTKIRLIIFFTAKDGETLYSQQKQDQELTVAQIMNSLLPNSDLNWRNTSASVLLTMWITTNCGKFLKRKEYQTILPASWEIHMQVKKQQLEPDMEQRTGSKLGKEYIKTVYCHPAYLTSMQSISWETLEWMKHKLESRLPGEISVTSEMQITPPLWQKQRGTKKPPDESERGDWKSWLKIQHSKKEDHGIWSDHFMENRETMEMWQTLFLGALKSLQMVTAAMKLKDTCSLKEKPWPTWTVY